MNIYIHTYIHIYIYMHIIDKYTYTYIHILSVFFSAIHGTKFARNQAGAVNQEIYVEREREKEREKGREGERERERNIPIIVYIICNYIN